MCPRGTSPRFAACARRLPAAWLTRFPSTVPDRRLTSSHLFAPPAAADLPLAAARFLLVEDYAGHLHHAITRHDRLPSGAPPLALVAGRGPDGAPILERLALGEVAAREALVAMAQKVCVKDEAQRVNLSRDGLSARTSCTLPCVPATSCVALGDEEGPGPATVLRTTRCGNTHSPLAHTNGNARQRGRRLCVRPVVLRAQTSLSEAPALLVASGTAICWCVGCGLLFRGMFPSMFQQGSQAVFWRQNK